MNYDSINYKNNYLGEVIIRLDFLNNIKEIETQFPKKITETARLNFPILEPQEQRLGEALFSQTGISTQSTTQRGLTFHGLNREKVFSIFPTHLAFQFREYTSYESLKAQFLDITNVCFETLPNLQCSRLGLRYINSINLEGSNPLSWDGFINKDLLGIFNFFQNDKNALTRVFHVLEYNFSHFNLKFQFGLPNPDYPATIKKRHFVLDMDAYYNGVQEQNEISRNLDLFHEKIQAIFESSIDNKLREKMNE